MVAFVGGRAWDEDDPCSVRYGADVEETDEEVRVRITAESPDGPDHWTCTVEGHVRTLTVELDEPLGDRRVVDVDHDRVRAVFLPQLRRPSWLPEGYDEDPREQPFDGTAEPAWMLLWRARSCRPVIAVVQGGAELAAAYPRNGAVPVSTHDVRGRQVPYERSPDGSTSVLAWSDDDGGSVVVASQRGCADEEPLPEETLLRVARSLR